MLPEVEQLDAIDESMWVLLQRNLAGITEAEADWRHTKGGLRPVVDPG